MTKWYLSIGLVAVLALGTVGYASAFTIGSGGTDVGSPDSLLAGASLGNSDDQTVVDWVNNTLGLLGYSTNLQPLI